MMAAFQLYPLVEIAWADGDLSEEEARSVLAAAERHGVQGSHLSDAVRVLDDILRRMQAHPDKKRAMLRPLQASAMHR